MFSLLSYGEVLVDFLPDDNGASYYPLAGGAPANVAVAFAKLGGESYFAGAVSTDNFGEMVLQQLNVNGVNTEYVSRTEHANTAVVLVSLDNYGERSFNFYRHNTADTQYSTSDIDKIDWQDVGVFHFCSNTLANTEMNCSTLYAIEQAKLTQTLISFDVNLRQQLWTEPSLLPERVNACLKQSDLVKLSKDEAEYLASQSGEHYQNYLKLLLSMGVKLIVVTDGSQPVHIVSSSFSALVETPTIKAIDTTAAGDSFIASFLFALTQEAGSNSLISSILSLEKVTKAALFAVKCGAYTCQQKGAFNALPSISEI